MLGLTCLVKGHQQGYQRGLVGYLLKVLLEAQTRGKLHTQDNFVVLLGNSVISKS